MKKTKNKSDFVRQNVQERQTDIDIVLEFKFVRT